MDEVRLIDANELSFVCSYNGMCMATNEKCKKCEYYVCSFEDVQNQPTAYDIDKVVEQLGKCVNEEIYLWASDEDDYDKEGKLIVRKITDLHKYGSECFDKAIEIVKGEQPWRKD